MSEKTFYENLQSVGVKKAIEYVDSDPKTAIPKLIGWARKIDRSGQFTNQIDIIEEVITDEDSNWHQLMMNVYDNIDHEVIKTLLENFLVNSLLIWGQRRKRAIEKYDCNIPWAILMDPTSACNLECIGCWAADYGNSMNMSLETLDGIIEQGKELGIYMYLYSGGEPMVRKKDIIKLCEKHDDCVFLAFTNGTLIDEKFADEMLRVKNFIPAISIEGFEEANDSRRGEGTYNKITEAMRILRERKLPFGASLCYTSANTEVIASEEFFNFMIDQGVVFAWLFTYMPVGQDASTELLATPEQRKHMYHKIRGYRSTMPIFTLDFWNDGEYVDGCIAGGRNYLHINANGDIEPCAFIHYSDTNIHESTLVEALQNPLFMQYKENQPFNDNHLRPCPLLDNPDRLIKMVENSGAKSTDMAAPEDVHDLSGKCEHAADKWAPVADELWKQSGKAKKTEEKEKDLVNM